MVDSLWTLLTAAVALMGIVGLILLSGRILKRTALGRTGAPGRLLVVRETIALDASRRLHLIRHGDRDVLLLTGGQTDVVVGWVNGPDAS